MRADVVNAIGDHSDVLLTMCECLVDIEINKEIESAEEI